jgi:hypothetical protein
VQQDLADHLGLGDERDAPHRPAAAGADENSFYSISAALRDMQGGNLSIAAL